MREQTHTRQQITGTSDISVDDAIARTLSVARARFREPDWFDVVTARGFISNGRVTHYQVTLDLGFEDTGSVQDEMSGGEYYFKRACGRTPRMGEHHTIETRL
jgi:flavin-binding protein dodecin